MLTVLSRVSVELDVYGEVVVDRLRLFKSLWGLVTNHKAQARWSSPRLNGGRR